MLAKICAAFLTASCASAFSGSQYLNLDKDSPNGGTPAPGGAQIFLDVTSTSHTLALFAALLPTYVINGKSFDVNFEHTFAGVDYKLTQVNVTSVTVGKTDMAFVDNTDTIRTTFSGIEATLAVEVSASTHSKLLPPLAITSVVLKNVSLQIDLATSSDDEVHWALAEDTVISIEDIEVTATTQVWQKILDEAKPAFMKVLNYGLQIVEGVVAGLVDVLNVELANEGPNTFVVDIKGMPFNLTMTRYPEFSNELNRIILHVASEFTAPDMEKYVSDDAIWADYSVNQKKQREQLYLHESFINTLLYDLNLNLNGEGFQDKIFQLLGELKLYYGDDATCDGLLSFPYDASEPISVSSTEGIIVGDAAQGGMRLDLQIMCANATTEMEPSVTLNLGLATTVDFLFDNFVITADIKDPQVLDTTATSFIGPLHRHSWDAELTYLITDLANGFNMRFEGGIDLKTEIPVVKFVAGILRNTLISPYVADQFVFGGFKEISDI